MMPPSISMRLVAWRTPIGRIGTSSAAARSVASSVARSSRETTASLSTSWCSGAAAGRMSRSWHWNCSTCARKTASGRIAIRPAQ